MVVFGLGATLVVLAVVFVPRKSLATQQREETEAALTFVRREHMTISAERGGGVCLEGPALVRRGLLRRADMMDAYGHEIVIRCGVGSVSFMSGGPDRVVGTGDDISGFAYDY